MHVVTIAKGMSQGHHLCPGVPPVTGCSFVTVNHSPVCRIGDKLQVHGSIAMTSHQDTIASGSSIFKIQGIPVAFVTSSTNMGDTLIQGDSLVDIKA